MSGKKKKGLAQLCVNCKKNNSGDRYKVSKSIIPCTLHLAPWCLQKAGGKVYKMSEEMKEYLGQVTEKHGFHTRMAVACR